MGYRRSKGNVKGEGAMTKFYETVLNVLKQDNRFFTEDGVLLRNAVYEAAMQMDTNLIRILLSDATTKEHFFKIVDSIAVFDKVGFGWVINNKELLADNYTRFKNKIGLTDSNGDMLISTGKVELVFPYKDCVLEGGQTKDEQQRAEIFYNETLAPDEVDRLLFPKAFCNVFHYSQDGVTRATSFSNENLIIKGNNLLAISSLLKRFEGKIKCIYIDPPYNTGSDSFHYNDNFNHSSWLLFMKNRLMLAKRLLRHDGFIFVQIDNREMSYLKVLMDEIFGRDNFINDIIWKRKGGSVNPQNRLNNMTDYILWYACSESAQINPVYTLNDSETQQYIAERFKYTDEKGRKYRLSPIISPTYSKTLVYEYKGYEPPKNGWSLSLEKMRQFEEEGRLYFPEDKKQRIQRKQFLDEYKGRPIGNLWSDINVINPMSKEAIGFVGQKPETLIQRVLELATSAGDIVLDFHLGTGTTAAVALKMNRKFIGIEQMDYLDTITISRLNDVLSGDEQGISSDVNWQGGGSFIYCELAKANQNFVDEIQVATTLEEIKDIYTRIIETGFISSRVNPKDIDANAEDFYALSLDDQKRFLMELLDKNLLYVNYCDIDDEEYGISDEDKTFTRSFYGEV